MCPTPLGNLGDMTPRALDALRSADVVCCEDTRVTGKLLAALGVAGKRLERLDEEVLGQRAAFVVDRVLAGETVVYCSDAGMPGVSDPGARLVSAVRDAGASVEVLPGPTAVATAYAASGFSCPRFYFGGFFPRKEGERRRALDTLAHLEAVGVFYESPHRLLALLDALSKAMPRRRVAVCRELTKVHEEVVVGSAAELASVFAARAEKGGLKGEIAVVIDVAGAQEELQAADEALARAQQEAGRLLASPGATKRDVVERLQGEFGISRNDAYRLVHESGAKP